MKNNTLHSLITARTLLDEALRLVALADRHSCSAALILLQDALEIVMLALLVEKDVDDQKALETKGFDDLIAELKRCGVKVPKSGTLKALNKSRVVVKHYGQLAEPLTVQNYSEAAEQAINSMVVEVLGRTIREIYLTDRLEDGEAKSFLLSALQRVQENQLLSSLVEVRKAIFVTVEDDYCIHKYEDSAAVKRAFMGVWGLGGWKAPVHTRDAVWIAKNVKTPIDYVQIDQEKLKLDCIEWGVSTADLDNLRRLTPDVFRAGPGGPWFVNYSQAYWGYSSAANANYCIDRAIALMLKFQHHKKDQRWHNSDFSPTLEPHYAGQPVLARARGDAEILGVVPEGQAMRIYSIGDGFVQGERYYYISTGDFSPERKYFFGYVKEISAPPQVEEAKRTEES